MKIVFYTSTNPGIINNYNISRLINECPENDYYFVAVKNNISKPNYFRIVLSELKNGKNYFRRDLKKIENHFKPSIKLFYKEENYFEVNKVNDNNSEKIISEINPDIIIQSGAGILKKNIFSIAKLGTLNVHHGIAPEIRGMNSTFWCLYYGLTNLLGVSCHFIDENLDTGTIINQYYYNYNLEDDYITIQKEIIKEGAKLLISAIDIISKPYNIIEKNINSYYFSKVDMKDYNKLRNNNFKSIDNSSAIKIKVKTKKIVNSI